MGNGKVYEDWDAKSDREAQERLARIPGWTERMEAMRENMPCPGTLDKAISDAMDALTFESIPFNYSRRKKVGRFLRNCYKCVVRERSVCLWLYWYKRDRRRVRELYSEIRALKLMEMVVGFMAQEVKHL